MLLKNSLNKHGFGLLLGLIIQYILGMSTNLFVHFPESGNEGVMWNAAKSQLLFNLHLYWGVLLFLGAVILYIRSFIIKDTPWKIASGIGFLSILFATIAGVLFVGSQSDMYSFIMALMFLTASLSYGWGLYASR